MTAPSATQLGELVVLIIAIIEQIEAKGRSRMAWAIIVLCIALLLYVGINP